MLFQTRLGESMPDLAALAKRVDECVRAFPLDSSNAGADMSITCDMFVGGSGGQSEGIKAFEKLTLLDARDNMMLFNVARTLLSQWRNTATGPSPSSTENNVRRIAAQKLGEEAVFDAVSPTLAAQTLSSAARVEADNAVKLAIAVSLWRLLKTRDIPSSVRTEAITSLKILADPYVQSSVDVLNAATSALKDINRIDLEIGPITVETIQKPRSPYRIPIIATATTAVLATGALVAFFWRPGSTALSGAGPLRRKAEAALRRRRAR